MYPRLLKNTLQTSKSFFLFGPRGVGKTTWLKHNTPPEAVYINLLESRHYVPLFIDPGRLAKLIPDPPPKWIVIDEIQRIPACLNEIHHLIESQKLTFVLTGSSARTLRKKGTNLLAGRALRYNMFPLTAMELGGYFSLSRSLKYGHLPSVFSEEDPQAYLESYIQTYLREEVMQEGLIRNLGSFSKFLELASFSQASILNYANIGRELGIDSKTVESYFSILEDLLIAYRIPAFTKNAKRRLIQSSKFYYFDTGVYTTLRPKGPFDRVEEIEGAGLETLVLQELIAINAYFEKKYQLYFWHTAAGKEVDFVLYGQCGMVAIEVKRTHTLREHDLRGMREFLSDYPMAKGLVFYGGELEENWGNIRALPLQWALQNLNHLI